MVVGAYGGPAALQREAAPPAQPGAGQVLVEVEAAGVAYADVLMRRGVYPENPRVPFTPGYDVVGRVTACGPGVDSLTVGTRVAALTVTGGATAVDRRTDGWCCWPRARCEHGVSGVQAGPR